MRSIELVGHITNRINLLIGDIKSWPQEQVLLVRGFRFLSEILILQTQCLAALIQENSEDTIKVQRDLSLAKSDMHQDSQLLTLLTKNVQKLTNVVLQLNKE